MIDELRHFLLVSQHGTFTEAARQAHLSQPALSASIARLEAFVGARLFHRDASGARVSAAGEALLPRARAAVSAVEEGRRAVREVLGLQSGEVRLGGGATVCTWYLPPVLTAFRRAHPGILLKLREVNSAQARELVDAGELDLAVIDDPGGEFWMNDELILVAAPGIPTDDAPFVTFPPGSSSRVLLERHFPGARVVMELSGIAAVLAFVRAGVGRALVSRASVLSGLERGDLVVVPDARTPLARTLSLVHQGLDRLPPAAAALRERLLAGRGPKPQGARRSRRQPPPSRR